MFVYRWMCLVVLAAVMAGSPAQAGPNLVEDPSFEQPKDRDRFGLVFAKWGGWNYEGDCSFAVGKVARTGKHSGLLIGGAGAKIRYAQLIEAEGGTYRLTAYIRGLDIGTGVWNQTTEFMFNGKYFPLKKNGTFGWTKLSYVGRLEAKSKVGPSFGLMAPGYFWIDDVAMEKVGEDVPLTPAPLLGQEESPIEPPGEIGPGAVRCAECGYRNMPAWKTCYACGTALEAGKAAPTGPPVKLIASFEAKSPFSGGTVVAEHATDGAKALRIDRSYVVMDGPQDWSGYDYLKADVHTDSPDPIQLYVEVRDKATDGYWTRVNYNTVVPPGASTVIVPVNQMYVGEKSRPGRMLLVNAVTRLVFGIGDKPPAPLFIDNIRLERDDSAAKVLFDGLYAFDLGTSTSPVMDGFMQVTPATLYSKGRGYGLKSAKVWRPFDALQPEPLYQDFLCIESGGLAVDVPNGRYRVFVNCDSASGFWGEYQVYRKRTILAEGKPAAADSMDFASFNNKYYRFWDVEDLPADDTFDKYQKAYFQEKTFDVDVTDGQLNLDFQGENWACSVSAVVIFPLTKADEGERFLAYTGQKRRFYFDNYFKRVLHRPTGDALEPSSAETARGYVTFVRDYMKDVYYNDTPLRQEVGGPLAGRAFAGEYEPLTVTVLPLKDLGRTELAVSDLAGPAGTIPASAVDVGFVSYRISRITMEGSVYTISPRLIMPTAVVELPKGVARRFWLTVRTPAGAKAGLYKGKVTIRPAGGQPADVPVEFTVLGGPLDAVDVPVGPWSYTINAPWPSSDPAAAESRQQMARLSLRRLREYGFTSFSGLPVVAYKGFRDGQPVLDFSAGDAQMNLAREEGFSMPVVTYCAFPGLNLYFQAAAEMKQAGFSDYGEFVKAIFSAVQKHADEAGWLPVYWNLGDEPIGENLTRSIANAQAYRKAFPKGPPFFTAASSFRGRDANDPHFTLSKALHVANWNVHDEDSVNLLHRAGSDWAFYNGGNRWTYGVYLYKAAKLFDVKFRLSWHWNCVAGDPYYALDCREDDYAWCNSSPDGRLIPAVRFEQLREGLDDYRRVLTLARLAKAKGGTVAAKSAEELIASMLGSFKLGQREAESILGPDPWTPLRRKLDAAIQALSR